MPATKPVPPLVDHAGVPATLYLMTDFNILLKLVFCGFNCEYGRGNELKDYYAH